MTAMGLAVKGAAECAPSSEKGLWVVTPAWTYLSSYSGTDGQQPIRQAAAAELGRPEFVTAESLQTYLSRHMPKVKREPLTDQDYWAVVSFMLVAPGLDVPADGISRDNAAKVAINPR